MRLAADIGGTNMRVALGSADGTISKIEVHDSPSVYTDGIELLTDTLKKLAEGHTIEGVTIGVPGSVSTDKRTLIHAAHLPAWSGNDMASALESALGAPVTLENDALLAALGEANVGAGKGHAIVAYIGIGTGIGAARIVDGRIDRNSFGFEAGHQYLSYDDEVELEELVSGTAVEEEQGVSAKELGESNVWQMYERRLAHGLYNTLLHWSPDCLVLGGSLMRAPGLTVEGITEELERINRSIPTLPPIRKGTLEYPGVVGALLSNS